MAYRFVSRKPSARRRCDAVLCAYFAHINCSYLFCMLWPNAPVDMGGGRLDQRPVGVCCCQAESQIRVMAPLPLDTQ